MADKNYFGLELKEAELDALVDNNYYTTPRNTKEELLTLEFLIKQ